MRVKQMKCPKCRKKIEKGIKFCPYCGMNLCQDTSVGQKKGSKKGRHRKKYLLILILLLFLVCLGIVMWVILSREINRNMLSFMTGSDKQNISYGAVMHDNGDITYRPGPNQISYDKECGEIYFNNLLMVYTFTDLSDEAAQKLADSVNGEIVGDISGAINAQQILVRESEFEELNDLANKLMESDDVLFAQVDYPIQLNENAVDSNPWSEDKGNPDTDRGNEKNPGGNDWWAEAVGAYTAWEYSGKGSPVNVGIIDSGFDIDHTDLEGQISFLPDYSVNSEDDHGTHVAGLIGAKNNSDGIRGVADTSNLVCVDWNPDSNTSYLSSGEYTEITKQLIEHNVQVINNSWAIGDFYSKEGYTRLLFGDSNDIVFLLQYLAVHVNGAYDSYVKSVESDVKRTGLDCIVMMTELLLNGEKDFLIVQAAGNGYCDMNKGVNTKYGGFYDVIDENFFNLLPSVKRNELFQHKITYDNIDEHILVVGAVKNKTDKKGNYKMTSFSNYGNNVDICAPGEEIFSTVCNNMYKQDSGTSMAAPIVSGSAALLWSLKPDMTASEVKELLISSAVTQAVGVGDGKGSQYPMLNVGNAVRTLMNQSRSLSELEGAYEDSEDFILLTALCGENGNLCCELEFDSIDGNDHERLKFEWDGTNKQIDVLTNDQNNYVFTMEFIEGKVKLNNQEGLPFDQVVLEKSNVLIVANMTLAVKNYFNQYKGDKLEKSDSYVYPTEGIYNSGYGESWSIVISENGKEKYIVRISSPECDVVGQASVYWYDEWNQALINSNLESLEELVTFSIYDYFDFG